MSDVVRPTWEQLRLLDQAALEQLRREKYALPLERMYLRHGKAAGQRCGDCTYLVKVYGDMSVTPFKCKAYGLSHSAHTDWRLKWPACGNFQAREGAGEPAGIL